uniref:adenine phosphoribosyltransferase n=1 Tax=Pithovirus LCPAC101 TaxID=2506586 RepID=A0A481Z5R8_9VIRU|nr:MAG: phosphoribosyl transferase domain protein [Pithovirus LCPAC101]
MSFVVALSSKSELKTSAVREALTKYAENINKKLVIICVSTKDAPIPVQPVNTGNKCAKLRNEYMKKELGNTEYDMLISIENSIGTMGFYNLENASDDDNSEDEEEDIKDACNIIIEDKKGDIFSSQSMVMDYECVIVSKKYYDMAKKKTSEDYKYLKDGLSVTVGSLIHKEFSDIPANNWMKDELFGGMDRKEQINEIISEMLEGIDEYNKDINKLKDAIIKVPDFPEPGVLFQDLSDILNNKKLTKMMLQYLIHLLNENIDKTKHNFFDDNIVIMGLDARGFIYGMALATKLKYGFIMARKAGKLPGKTVKQEYGTEYSKACIEVMPHLINKDTKVIVVDDLVATGGSLDAAVKLTKKCGGQVIACVTILQVDSLVEQARKKLGDIPLLVLIK